MLHCCTPSHILLAQRHKETHTVQSRTHTHSLSHLSAQINKHRSAFITMLESARIGACPHTHTENTNHKSKPSGADQLFSCGGRFQLRHLKRTEHSTWRRLLLLWFFTLRRSISLMQSCRALASIKSNIYQEIKRRERGHRGVLWHVQKNSKMERCREDRKKNTKQKTRLLLSGGWRWSDYRCFTSV